MTLTDFLLARIAEDEARVAGFHQGSDPDFMWGPDRVRAECEAKRGIVHQHGDGPEPVAHECPDGFMDAGETDPHTGFMVDCPTLKFLARPYASHPDYRDEWKP